MKRWPLTMVIPLMLLPLGAWSAKGGARMDAKVILGAENLGSVSFPEAWTRTDSAGHRIDILVGHYEIRTAQGSTSDILVGVREVPSGAIYADQFYAVRVGTGFRVRSASVEEWSRATQLPAHREQVPWPGDVERPGASIRFHGRTFTPSGQLLHTVLPSPHDRFVAILSATQESERPGLILPGFSGDAFSNGTLFLDIYDVGSGKKLAAGRARYSDSEIFFQRAFWAGTHHFILPLDTLLQYCFIAQL